jgi:hypothetical protein
MCGNYLFITRQLMVNNFHNHVFNDTCPEEASQTFLQDAHVLPQDLAMRNTADVTGL